MEEGSSIDIRQCQSHCCPYVPKQCSGSCSGVWEGEKVAF